MVRYRPLSWSSLWYVTNLIDSCQSGKKGRGTDTGNVGNSSKKKMALHQELSSAVQATYPSYAGLRVPGLEVRRSPPNTIVQVLLPVHIGTLVTGIFTMILLSTSLPTTSDFWEIRLKVTWFGEPLWYAARQKCKLTERWPGSSRAERSGSTAYPGYPQKVSMTTQCIVPNEHNRLSWGFPVLFPLRCKANAIVQHAKTGHGLHSSHTMRLNFTAT
jgi:hypothetical protein